jgi:hypothetical protein
VTLKDAEGVLGLPPSILCSHCYIAFPQFKLKKGDVNEDALHRTSKASSRRDLVEVFIAYGVWPPVHDWEVGEVKLRSMPFLKDRMVLSPAFTVELRGRDAMDFVREVEAEVVKIVRKYSTKTEMLKSWDIRGSNVRLNRVFELNNLQYDPYPEEGSIDAGDIDDRKRKGMATHGGVDEGFSKGKVVAMAVRKKRRVEAKKMGLAKASRVAEASDRFVVELAETCAKPGRS